MAISTVGGVGASSGSGNGATEWGGMGIIAGGYSATGQVTLATPKKGTFYLSHDQGTNSRFVVDYGGAASQWTTNFYASSGAIYNYNFPGTSYTATSNPASVSVYGYWASNTTPTATYAAAYGAGVYVYGDGSGNIYSSPDMVTWTSRHNMAAVITRAIIWTGGLFVATGSNAGGGTGTISTSPDGITWTAKTTPQTTNRDIAFGAGVAISAGGTALYSSTDYTAWTSRQAGSFQAVAHNGLAVGSGSMFVGVAGASIYTSPDGLTWTSRSNPSGVAMNSVAFGNGVWVATGDSSTILSSPDAGVTWTARTNTGTTAGSSYSFYSVAYNAGRFIAASSAVMSSSPGAGFWASTDGITWRPVGGTAVQAQAGQPRYLSAGNSRFLCANQASSLSNSLDGLAGAPNSFALMSSGYQTLN